MESITKIIKNIFILLYNSYNSFSCKNFCQGNLNLEKKCFVYAI